MRSRITTLMFVDLVGYSAMMSSNQNAAIEAVRELKNTHLEPVLSDFGGEILKRMGDGWIIAFSSIGAALDSAIQVQTNLYGHRTIKLRIGCHLGEIVEDDDDFFWSRRQYHATHPDRSAAGRRHGIGRPVPPVVR